jgi:PAS domain S-box-containing protein
MYSPPSITPFDQQVIDLARIGYSVWDFRRKTYTWSPILEELYGLSPGAFVGTFEAFLYLVYEADRDHVRHEVQRAVAQKSNYSFTCRPARSPDHWLNHEGSMKLESGRLVQIVEIVTNVTLLRQAQEAVVNAEAKLNSLIQYSSDLVLQVGLDGLIWNASSTSQKIMGYVYWQLTNHNIFDFIEEADRPQFAAALRQWAIGETAMVEFRGRHHNREVLHLEASGSFLPVNEGVPGVVITLRNLTERRKAEAQSEHFKSQLLTILEATADGILAIDNKAKLIHYNQKFLQLWNISREQIAAFDDFRLVTFMAEQLSNPESFWQQVRQESSHPMLNGHGFVEFKDDRVLERYSSPQEMAGEIVGRVVSYREISVGSRSNAA